MNKILFFAFWFWIAFVSSYDSYLTVQLRDVIRDSEQNPVARYIMSLDNWDVSLFIGIKTYGTVIVLGFLIFLYFTKKSYAFVVIIALAIFQTALLFYLSCDVQDVFSLAFI